MKSVLILDKVVGLHQLVSVAQDDVPLMWWTKPPRSRCRSRCERQQNFMDQRDRRKRGEGDWGDWEEFHPGHVFRPRRRVAVTNHFENCFGGRSRRFVEHACHGQLALLRQGRGSLICLREIFFVVMWVWRVLLSDWEKCVFFARGLLRRLPATVHTVLA